MFIRKTGYVARTNDGQTSCDSYSSYDYDVSDDDYQPDRIEKIGRILTPREEKILQIRKNADMENFERQGIPYYQVISNEGACDVCQSHDGAFYPVSDAREGENLPPFHPNCKCRIIGFYTGNPNDDPMLSEIIFWVDIIIYGVDKSNADVIEFIIDQENMDQSLWGNNFTGEPSYFQGEIIKIEKLDMTVLAN